MCRLLCARSPGVIVEVLNGSTKLRIRLDIKLREVSLPARLAAPAVVNRPAQPDSVPPPLSPLPPLPPYPPPYPLVSHPPTPVPTTPLHTPLPCTPGTGRPLKAPILRLINNLCR